ncbi:Alpha/Beta hydrolase protein [Xylariales sp. AK1849]|nr:Alpha/Beta hydrolase protein [Xylariales sp. AK1849]
MKFSQVLFLSAQLGTQLVVEAAYNGTENSTVGIYPLSTDDQFSFVLTEALALANGGGSATSEILRAASQIVPGDFESWFNEFNWLGDRIHELATQAKTATSKREALFRAASYHRLSSFFLTANASDPRLYSTHESALEDFHEAISLLPVPGKNFTVSGPGYDIPGYFFKARNDDCTKVPTFLIGNGYDAPQQDSWHALGREILDRGWNFVTYEGPGQPTVRRQQGLGFRPDWWNVVTPVVDYLAQRGDVDMDNVALAGISFGGQLAPLAATREHRVKAVLSIDGITNLQQAILGQFGDQLNAIFSSGNASYFDAVIKAAVSAPGASSKFRWVTGQGLWVFNTTSYFSWMSQMAPFALTQERVDNITAYGWVGRGEGDDSVGGQETTLAGYYNASGRHNASFHTFPTDLGAGLHCQLGAEPHLAQVAFDWLDGIFSN